MAIQVSYPGVYIDEFAPASPIQGAGTSTAAFLGLNAYGSPMTPTLLTNWDAYLALFAPPAPTPPDDDDYLWYAVRGFFARSCNPCSHCALSPCLPRTPRQSEPATASCRLLRRTCNENFP